jgi:hypothetical protein
MATDLIGGRITSVICSGARGMFFVKTEQLRTCRHIAISTDIPYNPIIGKNDFPVS